ncbi:MAG: ParA family protein, partial [Coriobacteriia bacterium]|nr:ParA family protein [Coriobacteriia bacterium]
MQSNGIRAVKSLTEAPWLTIITGHYGVGKTNLSLNIARDLCQVTSHVTLVDLDVVNPYFRSTDNRGVLDAYGIRVLGPVYGASNLDTPSLSPGIDDAIV